MLRCGGAGGSHVFLDVFLVVFLIVFLVVFLYISRISHDGRCGVEAAGGSHGGNRGSTSVGQSASCNQHYTHINLPGVFVYLCICVCIQGFLVVFTPISVRQSTSYNQHYQIDLCIYLYICVFVYAYMYF